MLCVLTHDKILSRAKDRLPTHSSSSNGSADGHNSLLLSNDASVECLLHLDELLTLITADLLNGDTCSHKFRKPQPKAQASAIAPLLEDVQRYQTWYNQHAPYLICLSRAVVVFNKQVH